MMCTCLGRVYTAEVAQKLVFAAPTEKPGDALHSVSADNPGLVGNSWLAGLRLRAEPARGLKIS
jgi:hypothetical protein